MDNADQAEPGADRDTAGVHQMYLTTDVRAAIGVASAEQMRSVLRDICEHLCRLVRHDIGGVPPLGTDRRQLSEVWTVGCGIQVGLEVYRHVIEAVAGNFLRATGFDTGRAVADDAYIRGYVEPFLASARTQRMRAILLGLVSHLHALVDEADIAAALSAATVLPDELWEIATGATAAMQLYRHAVRVVAAHVLYYVWTGLDIGSTPSFVPFSPSNADAAFFTVNPN